MSSASLIGLGHNLATYTLGQFRTGIFDNRAAVWEVLFVFDRWKSASAYNAVQLRLGFCLYFRVRRYQRRKPLHDSCRLHQLSKLHCPRSVHRVDVLTVSTPPIINAEASIVISRSSSFSSLQDWIMALARQSLTLDPFFSFWAISSIMPPYVSTRPRWSLLPRINMGLGMCCKIGRKSTKFDIGPVQFLRCISMTSKGCRRHSLHEFSAQLKCTFNQRMANAICALPKDNRCHVVQGTAASMRLVQV